MKGKDKGNAKAGAAKEGHSGHNRVTNTPQEKLRTRGKWGLYGLHTGGEEKKTMCIERKREKLRAEKGTAWLRGCIRKGGICGGETFEKGFTLTNNCIAKRGPLNVRTRL